MPKPAPSCLYSGNTDFIEQLYEQYLAQDSDIAPEWVRFFDQLQENQPAEKDIQHSKVIEAYINAAQKNHLRTTQNETIAPAASSQADKKQAAVLQLINAYRFRGHRNADLDPLKLEQRPEVEELEPANHNLDDNDFEQFFNTGSLFAKDRATLREILQIVRNTYCRSIGAEYMHINDTQQKRWIQEYIETNQSTPTFGVAKKKRILNRLIAATELEQYLHTKYVGQKRFSLEGGESLIPLMDELIQSTNAFGAEEVVIGMAHRGRLNVLVNCIGKLPSDLFDEFEGKTSEEIKGSGDVKYHMGYSSDIKTPTGNVHLTLAFNPSHLEIIDPVVEGSVRARQERRQDTERKQVVPVLIHGDAAFAGQGVVMETFNLSQTRGYLTGGTIHIIINNQIGFTTSDPLDSRSTLYCTDVAKMVQAPIFHVNGDDPEAVVFVTKLACDYRNTFHKDVVIDMICYRKHGHSESDEPYATQPLMYQAIKQHTTVRDSYAKKLITEQIISQEEVDAMSHDYIDSLDKNERVSGARAENINQKYAINFSPFKDTHWTHPANTSIDETSLADLSEKITAIPEGFSLHMALDKTFKARKKMGLGEIDIDWGYAETMAYASLLEQGFPIRISGQDSARGTFFHRHAVVHDQKTGDMHLPLQHLSDNQASFLVINSTLSEEAVLAYEYGYSTAEPNALVIWEAQFGDFANGAQVVIDQFISSCESKWGRYCGLVLLLPHGYDGQGPEHSSARLERYLQLCAEQNMQVCFPSTPAQMFHLLRRQMIRPYRKPLIVMSPKSLLRRKLSVSPVQELVNGEFKNIIDEIDDIQVEQVQRLLICSGKVYFDLLEQRRENNITNIAIIRIEQLFPFPHDELTAAIQRYPNAREVVWVQEEPKNQGAWYYMQSRRTMIGCLRDDQDFGYAGRAYSASPACGYMGLHLQQQKQLIADALQLDKLEVTHKKHAYSATKN